MVAQWPKTGVYRLRPLTMARAIDHQMFVVCCNSCGNTYGDGGNSAVIDPYGKTIVLAGETEEIIYAECDLQMMAMLREKVPMFRERRPELY